MLSGKLVTRRESMKEPLPACVRRKKSLASKVQRRTSLSAKDAGAEEVKLGGRNDEAGAG